MDERQKLLKKLKPLRLKKEMTQMKFSKELGVGYPAYVLWEKEVVLPNYANYLKLKEAIEKITHTHS